MTTPHQQWMRDLQRAVCAPCQARPLVGVAWDDRQQRWRASVRLAGRRIAIGCYDDAFAAAVAHDDVAIELHSPFAALNVPSRPESDLWLTESRRSAAARWPLPPPQR